MIMVQIYCHLVIFVIIMSFILVVAYTRSATDEPFKLHDWSWNKDTDLVIVVSQYKEYVEWLNNTKVPVIVCSKTDTTTGCYVNKNKGREVSGYLRFILQNYHRLPKHIAFIHGHEEAWHQKLSPNNMLKAITECAKYKKYGYVSLNNYYFDDRKVATNKLMKELHLIWDEWFRPFLQRDAPTYVLHDCCAQFIVSRERVIKNSKAAYLHWYDKITMHKNDYEMGLIFEYIWHIIFGEPDVVRYNDYKRTINESCLQ